MLTSHHDKAAVNLLYITLACRVRERGVIDGIHVTFLHVIAITPVVVTGVGIICAGISMLHRDETAEDIECRHFV